MLHHRRTPRSPPRPVVHHGNPHTAHRRLRNIHTHDSLLTSTSLPFQQKQHDNTSDRHHHHDHYQHRHLRHRLSPHDPRRGPPSAPAAPSPPTPLTPAPPPHPPSPALIPPSPPPYRDSPTLSLPAVSLLPSSQPGRDH